MLAGRVAALTGITPLEWKRLAAAFPALGRGAGVRAAARRLLLVRLASRRLTTGRWTARLEGEPPGPEPTVYASAHIGSLQALRYTLRARGIRVAIALGPRNLDRPEPARQDRIFDARHPLDFPHFFPAERVHRLRTALRSGSLILPADLPVDRGVDFPFLGGRVRLDRRPFRLAKAAGVGCRPAFLTLPRGRWTVTLGRPLPGDEDAALEAFARCLSEVAERSPADIDGVVYLNLARSL